MIVTIFKYFSKNVNGYNCYFTITIIPVAFQYVPAVGKSNKSINKVLSSPRNSLRMYVRNSGAGLQNLRPGTNAQILDISETRSIPIPISNLLSSQAAPFQELYKVFLCGGL